ncbi:MAG: hypothetical protein ABJA70_21370, partial [Chryseolinea sp.]
MTRLTEDPRGCMIFGRAEALAFLEERDMASLKEKAERPWKEDYPVYLRVRNPIFIDGTMADCTSFYELIETFKYNSFPQTKLRFDQ